MVLVGSPKANWPQQRVRLRMVPEDLMKNQGAPGPEGEPIRECLVAGVCHGARPCPARRSYVDTSCGPPPMRRAAGVGDTAREVAVKAEGVNGFLERQRLASRMWNVTSLCTLWGSNCTKCLHSFSNCL